MIIENSTQLYVFAGIVIYILLAVGLFVWWATKEPNDDDIFFVWFGLFGIVIPAFASIIVMPIVMFFVQGGPI